MSISEEQRHKCRASTQLSWGSGNLWGTWMWEVQVCLLSLQKPRLLLSLRLAVP